MPSTTLLGRLGGSSGGCRAAIDTSVFTIEWLIWLPRVARAIERRGDGALGRSFDEDRYSRRCTWWGVKNTRSTYR